MIDPHGPPAQIGAGDPHGKPAQISAGGDPHGKPAEIQGTLAQPQGDPHGPPVQINATPPANQIDWSKATRDYFGAFPHPQSPTGAVSVADWPTAANLAHNSKFGTPANPAEIEGFWKEFQGMNQRLGERAMTPDDYLTALKQLAPLSFAYHDRPPTMNEVSRLNDAHPKDQRSYYEALPDQLYPTVPSGDMVRMLKVARPFAQQFLGRPPVKSEAQFFYHAGMNAGAIQQHYSNSAAAKSPQGGAPSGSDQTPA